MYYVRVVRILTVIRVVRMSLSEYLDMLTHVSEYIHTYICISVMLLVVFAITLHVVFD